jgi:adenine deaminase
MLEPPDSQTVDFVRSLPKTETHLHIEGALPWELLRGLDPERYRDPPASWGSDFRFRSFAHFEEELLSYVFAWFTSPDRYLEAASIVFAGHLEQNVKYVECSFASGVLEFGGVDGEGVAEAIRAAVPPGLEVRIFMGIHRNGYNERTQDFLEASLGWKELDGLDLHGPEDLPLEPWTASLWRRAREAGKFTKAHAGEFGGPESVRQVLDELGVRRIQHGVRSIEDPALVERLSRDRVALDICPISNLKLGVVPSFEAHPLPAFLEVGIVCTVSTDDPVSFGNSLTEEYLVLSERVGLAKRDLARIALNGFRVALTEPNIFAPQVREMEAIIQAG